MKKLSGVPEQDALRGPFLDGIPMEGRLELIQDLGRGEAPGGRRSDRGAGCQGQSGALQAGSQGEERG
jgi:hypothetical protein